MTEENNPQKKLIGEYKILSSIEYNKKDENNLILNLEISENLQEVLKSISLDEIAEESPRVFYISQDGTEKIQHFKRYKVKGFIYRSLYLDRKEFLFIKELIDTGKIKIKFSDIDKAQQFKRDFAGNIRTLLKRLNELTELNTTIIFKNED